jgi:50S ribosomal subunit-associated GTPase HflX
VIATLNEIGAASTPQILVLNKIDKIPADPDPASIAPRILSDPGHQPAGAVAISARTGAGFDGLLQKIDETLALDPVSKCVFHFPIAEGAPLHLLHEHGRVTATRYTGEECEVEALTPASIKRRLEKYLVPAS